MDRYECYAIIAIALCIFTSCNVDRYLNHQTKIAEIQQKSCQCEYCENQAIER